MRNAPTSRHLAVTALLAAGLTACGSSSSSNNDDGGGPALPPAPNTAVITSTDFMSAVGLVSTLDLDSFEITNELAEVSTDPVPRIFDGIVYIVNRFFADNIQALDPAAGFSTTVQFSTENGSNPQDAVVIGDRAFVTRFEPAFSDVQVLDLTDGSTVGTIDLLPFADTDTDESILPRPGAIELVDGLLYVALGQFDENFAIFGSGSVAVIDPETLAVVDDIDIGLQAPSAFDVVGSDLWVSASGVLFPVTLSGGVAKIDTTTGAVTQVLDDDVVGGNLGSIAIVSDELGYIQGTIVNASATASTGEIFPFNPTTGALGTSVFSCDGFTPGFGYNGADRIVVLCQDFLNPGVSVLDAATGATLAGPIDTVLPPFGVDFL